MKGCDRYVLAPIPTEANGKNSCRIRDLSACSPVLKDLVAKEDALISVRLWVQSTESGTFFLCSCEIWPQIPYICLYQKLGNLRMFAIAVNRSFACSTHIVQRRKIEGFRAVDTIN